MPCMIRAPHRRPRASTGARVSPAEASQRLERLAIADRTSGRQHGGTEGAVHEPTDCVASIVGQYAAQSATSRTDCAASSADVEAASTECSACATGAYAACAVIVCTDCEA